MKLSLTTRGHVLSIFDTVLSYPCELSSEPITPSLVDPYSVSPYEKLWTLNEIILANLSLTRAFLHFLTVDDNDIIFCINNKGNRIALVSLYSSIKFWSSESAHLMNQIVYTREIAMVSITVELNGLNVTWFVECVQWSCNTIGGLHNVTYYLKALLKFRIYSAELIYKAHSLWFFFK